MTAKLTPSYSWSMTRIRRLDQAEITTGKYAVQTSTMDSDVYQNTVVYPNE